MSRTRDYGFTPDHWDGPPPGMTPEGVRFNEWLRNQNGAGFSLIRATAPTHEAQNAARRWLHNNRDVVGRVEVTDEPWEWAKWYADRGLDPESFVVVKP